MEGVRFYLPRPFVNVYQSFPIATDLYLADGVVSPDGQYIIIRNVRAESPVGRFFVAPADNGVQPGVQVPNAQIGAPNPESISDARRLLLGLAGPATPHSGGSSITLAALTNILDQASAATGKATTAATQAEVAKEDAQKAAATRDPVSDTGKNRRKVINDNGAFAYQPLRGSMDIVYMPDFEEQYVASSKSGLGNAEFTLAMGQGWSLQGLDSFSDNSQLNRLMYELIGTAMDAAKAFATSGTSVGVDAIASVAAKMATPHRGGIDPQDTPGTPVTLRISVVYYAAKGLYPLIKPRELKGQPQSTFLLTLTDPSRVGAFLRNIKDEELQREIAAFDGQQPRFSKPVYPYQYISFNTFRYMNVEVLTKNGLAFNNLYPDQGTITRSDAPALPPPVGDSGALDSVGERPMTDAVVQEKLTAFQAQAFTKLKANLLLSNDVALKAVEPTLAGISFDLTNLSKNVAKVKVNITSSVAVPDAARNGLNKEIQQVVDKMFNNEFVLKTELEFVYH